MCHRIQVYAEKELDLYIALLHSFATKCKQVIFEQSKYYCGEARERERSKEKKHHKCCNTYQKCK